MQSALKQESLANAKVSAVSVWWLLAQKSAYSPPLHLWFACETWHYINVIFWLVDFRVYRIGRVTRGHLYKIFKHHCPSSTRSSFFSERVADIWNGLSSHHTDLSSLPRFKRCINSIDFSDYLKFVWLVNITLDFNFCSLYSCCVVL